jgi:hypothetical protein
MIPKSGNRFSGKIMLERKTKKTGRDPQKNLKRTKLK